MLFVDTNIFMYAVGAEHDFKEPCLNFFSSVARGKLEIAINAEVLQEILYRFWSIRRMREGHELYDYARGLCHWIYPVTTEDVDMARSLMKNHTRMGPRDAIHTATMKKHRIATVVSYDRHFDRLDEIKRIEPE